VQARRRNYGVAAAGACRGWRNSVAALRRIAMQTAIMMMTPSEMNVTDAMPRVMMGTIQTSAVFYP
jgi:hypothetical protein